MFYSPLRYPGGKNRLSQSIAEVCSVNAIKGHFIEPFSGGASVALHLLIEGKVEQITLNDYDRSVYAFWYSVLNHTEALCARIEEVDLTMAVENNVSKQKALVSQSGSLIGDILNQEFAIDASSETSIELNLAMIKIKHTIKKGRKAID